MPTRPIRVVFGWSGLPIYAARCIEYCRGQMHAHHIQIEVIYTKPSVPITGLAKHLKCSHLMVAEGQHLQWSDLGVKIPDLFIHTGWAYPVFMSLGTEVRAAGGQVVSMVDNCWKGNIRQILGAIYFRIRLRRLFLALWVPGRSTTRLARFLGMPSGRICNGLYGMDPNVFNSKNPLFLRNKQFLFIGSLIQRKGLPELLNAFVRFSREHPEWTLKIIGNGPLLETIPHHPRILHQCFSPPEEIAEAMAMARALILPSREEHWGLVVHEATLSGCALLLSDKVGAHADLLDSNKNGILFPARNQESIIDALKAISIWTEQQWSCAERLSLVKAKSFGPERFYQSFRQILELYVKQESKV